MTMLRRTILKYTGHVPNNDDMSSDHSLSLVERKKLQWAKEREEIAALCGPWPTSDRNSDQTSSRNRYESKLSMVGKNNHDQIRRGSLPPLHKNQYNSRDRYDKEGGETSGYGSDNPNRATPDCVQNWNQSGYESSSSRDDRPKWGDKGVGVGKFWQAKDESFEKIATNEPPNWVKRGLKDGEIIVSNTSPAESPEQKFEDQERPCTSSSYSQSRTHIRGQNIQLDAVELAERERRRRIAMAHQEAILQQLEERERMKREDRARRIREEYEEEVRIKKEQEIERQRKEEEMKMLQEKQERDRRRKEAIEEAIELAQKQAQQDKLKRSKQNDLNDLRNLEHKHCSSRTTSPIIIAEAEDNLNNVVETKSNNCDQPIDSEYLNNSKNNNSETRARSVSPKFPNEEAAVGCSFDSTEQLNNQREHITENIQRTPRLENNVTLVLPTTIESLKNFQYALLLPATPQNIPAISIPLTDRSCSTARTENRILTPSQYRNKNNRVCDSSTQTEESVFSRVESSAESREKYVREKLNNLELTYENKIRKERRSRSESVEERPKWNANRPPTRYMKQSEKDPLYQRKKLRQKLRDTKYDDKNSSDDSQTATPRSYRKRSYVDKRAHWRKNDMFTRNVRMYQTEIVPLESDRDQIYYKKNGCCCTCRCGRHRCSEVEILKIEDNSPRDIIHYKSENSDRLPEVGNINGDILEKLSSLHTGLLMKKEQWENVPSTPSSSSLKRQLLAIMAKLDDFLTKKKETAPILDLSKTTISSDEEFRRLLEKVPDFKMKPERVLPESIKIKDKTFKFNSSKKELKKAKQKYAFMDPIPVEMRKLKLEDLAAVSIDWKMLTSLRPKSKVEESFFSRLVELGKLENKSRAQEKRRFQVDPQIRKIKNKAGVVEMRIVSCSDCAEDFCNGRSCSKTGYDSFARLPDEPKVSQKVLSPESGSKKKRTIKMRSRSKSKSKSREKARSKSPKKSIYNKKN